MPRGAGGAAESGLSRGFEGRLETVIDLFDTRKSAAEVAGKSVDQLQAYLKGRSAVPFEAIARLCADKGVSLDWLAFGGEEDVCLQSGPAAGDRQAGTGRPSGTAGALREEGFAFTRGPEGGWIPPVAGLTGCSREAGAAPQAEVPTALVSRLARQTVGPLGTLTARGDAMTPLINDGDLVVVDTGDTALSDGCLYALRARGHPLLRRVSRQAHGGLRLSAERAGTADEPIAAAEVDRLDVIGRLVWAGSAR